MREERERERGERERERERERLQEAFRFKSACLLYLL